MSYGSQSMHDNRSTIDPYYIKGDVFQRDQRYYDQLLERRSRSPYRSRVDGGSNVRQTVASTEELRRLREENTALMNDLQKLSYGGEFGTGDEVVKKNYYNTSSS